jgi:prepilin-type processing-associated H-X9-DG protein
VRAAADRLTCANNLKQFALAAQNHNFTHHRLPPMYAYSVGSGRSSQVFFDLLPFIEQDNLFNTARGYPYPGNPTNPSGAYARVAKLFNCPADRTYGDGFLNAHGHNYWALSCYGANYQAFGKPDAGDNNITPTFANMDGQMRLTSSFPDGTSNTMIFSEKYARCGTRANLWAHGSWDMTWMPAIGYGNPRPAPYGTAYSSGFPGLIPMAGTVGPAAKFQVQPDPDDTCDSTRAQSAHSSGIHVAFADGAVKYISSGVEATTWWYLMTPNGGEIPGDY